jgi:AhpD family alkylhydroperoxidase
MHGAANQDGALDPKTKELIALASGIAGHCIGCVAWHAKAVHELGATREEVAEMIGIAVQMGGGPSLFFGSEALEAYDEFSAAGTKDAATG